MPNVTPDSPNLYTEFGSGYEHIKAHRALEAAIESLDTVGSTTTGTNSMVALIATNATITGTATLNTTSTVALVATNSTISGTETVNTLSTVVLIANRVGFGGAVPSTSSTAAPVKGIFRTAATVNLAIPSMSTTSVISTVFSVAAQMGNAIQPGDPVWVLPQTAWPAATVQGEAVCTDTNSITISWRAISGINATTTVAVHVFTYDIT